MMSLNLLTKSLKKHSVVVLVLATGAAIFGVIRFQDMPLMQFQILVILSILYLGWALLHHNLDKSLTLEIIIEYVLTALLAMVILYGILV